MLKLVKMFSLLFVIVILFVGCGIVPLDVGKSLSEYEDEEILSYVRSNYCINEVYNDATIKDYCKDNYWFDEIYDEDMVYDYIKDVYNIIDPDDTDALVEYIISMYDIEDIEAWYQDE